MEETKTVSVAFRVTPRFKRLLEIAAAREHRSQTNLLEALLFAHCERLGLDGGPPKHTASADQAPGATR